MQLSRPSPHWLVEQQQVGRSEMLTGTVVRGQASNASKAASPTDIAGACRAVAAVPTLVVVGERDRVAPHAAGVSRSLAHSRLSILPACGHLSHEESPGVLVGALASFASEVLLALGSRP